MIKEEAARPSTPLQSFNEMFEHAIRFLSNLYEIWINGNKETRSTFGLRSPYCWVSKIGGANRRNHSSFQGPNLIWPRDCELPQQVWINAVLWVLLAGVRPLVDGLQPHDVH
jgi:hypothetical protein